MLEMMLEMIQEEYHSKSLHLHSGIPVTLRVEVYSVPLIVPEKDGQWVLRECTEYGLNAWKLRYRYRVPVYFVQVMDAGGRRVELAGTLTPDLTEACDRVAVLNQTARTSKGGGEFQVGVRE